MAGMDHDNNCDNDDYHQHDDVYDDDVDYCIILPCLVLLHEWLELFACGAVESQYYLTVFDYIQVTYTLHIRYMSDERVLQ